MSLELPNGRKRAGKEPTFHGIDSLAEATHLTEMKAREKQQKRAEYKEELKYLEENFPEEITAALKKYELETEGTSEERIEKLLDTDMELEDVEEESPVAEKADSSVVQIPVNNNEEKRLAQTEKQEEKDKIAANLKLIKEKIEARERGSIREHQTVDSGKGDASDGRQETSKPLDRRKAFQGAVQWAKKIEAREREERLARRASPVESNPKPKEPLTAEQIGDVARKFVYKQDENIDLEGFTDADKNRVRELIDKLDPSNRKTPSPETTEPVSVQVKENIIPITVKKETKAEASAETEPAKEPVRVFTEPEKQKIKDLADRLQLEGDYAKMSDEEKKFYADPMNKSAIHRERTLLSRRETKFEDVIENARGPILEHGKLVEQAKATIKDERVLSAIDKMKLNLSYVYNVSPEFFNMDPDKQIYILEKTRQKVSHDATFEAKARVEKDLSRKSKSVGDWFKKKFQGLTKEFEETKARRQVIEEIKGKGMLDYVEDMKFLTNHVKNLEVPIKYGENGKLSIEYVRPDFFPPGMAYEKRLKKGETMDDFVKSFNESATALSEIPQEWALSKFTWNKKKYNEASRTYELRKTILIGAVLEKYQKEMSDEKQAETAAMMWMNNIDTNITTNQILTEHPELDKQDGKGFSWNVEDIDPADTKKKWGLGAAGMIVGGVGRALTRTNYGLYGSLIFGGALGGVLAGRKQWTEYTDKEKKKRYGAAGIDDKGIKRFLEGEQQIGKLEFLIERFDLEEDEAKKAEFGRMLRNRASALDQRIKEGRVNYGGKEEQTFNKLKLRQLIAEANTRAFSSGAFSDVKETQEFYKRLGGVQRDFQRQFIRGRSIAWAAAKGAAKGAGGALAGWFLMNAWEGGTGRDQDVPNRAPGKANYEGRVPSYPPPSPVDSIKIPVQESGGIPAGVNAPVDETSEIPVGVDAPVAEEAAPTPEAPVQEAPTVSEPAPAEKVVEKVPELTDREELLKEIKQNVREVRNAYGELERMEIRNPLKAEDAAKFIKKPGDFLVEDMSKWDVEDKFRTRSWGIRVLNNVKEEAKDFLAWQEYSVGYPEGSEQHAYALKEMERLGGIIHDKAGNIFAPYEAMAGSVSETLAAPDDNLLASLEGGAPENAVPPAPETDAAAPAEGGPSAPAGSDDSFLADLERSAGIPAETAPAPADNNFLEQLEADASTLPETATGPVFNDEIAKFSPAEKGGTMDFNDRRIEGRISFSENSSGVLQVIEDKDFTTEAGRAFRANTPKYLTFEEIMEVAKKENMKPRDVMNAFESFIDMREALQLSGMPLDSAEAVAIKSKMASLEMIFNNKDVPAESISVLDRVQLVEKGGDIRKVLSAAAESVETPAEIPTPESPLAVQEIAPDSRIYEIASEKYGVGQIKGNVINFKDHIGFYAESLDVGVAKAKILAAAEANRAAWSGLGYVEEIETKLSNGVKRYLIIYKKA